MPGTIRVSVLEAVDLPEDGTIGKDVTAKVTLGPRLFKTHPGIADGGKIAAWNSDFAFPVMNLRDKLVISICDSKDHSVTQTAIEIPSIIQKGSRDEFVALNKGGRIHLKMSFVLTEDERKKVEVMRVAALKRKEEAERLKKTVIMQPVTPEKELKKSPVSTVAILEVDISTTGDKKDLKEPANRTLGGRNDSTILGDKKDSTAVSDKKDSITSGNKTDSIITGDKKETTIVDDKKNATPKSQEPKPIFNYAKAIGMPSSAKKTPKKPSSAVSDSSANEVEEGNGDVNPGVQTVRESAKDAGEAVSSKTIKLDASVEAPCSGDGAAPIVTKVLDSTSQGSPEGPAGESDDANNQVKANNLDMNSENAVNAEELGHTKLDGAAPIETGVVDTVAQATPPATEAESGVPENSTDEVGEANKGSIETGAQTLSESAENSGEVGSSGNSKLITSAVESSPSCEHKSTSLIIASLDNASREHLPLSIRSPSSGTITLKTVKAQVKKTLSRVTSRRSSNRVLSSNSLSRTPPPVPVIWVQEAVRRALSNVKGCYGLNPSTVNH